FGIPDVYAYVAADAGGYGVIRDELVAGDAAGSPFDGYAERGHATDASLPVRSTEVEGVCQGVVGYQVWSGSLRGTEDGCGVNGEQTGTDAGVGEGVLLGSNER